MTDLTERIKTTGVPECLEYIRCRDPYGEDHGIADACIAALLDEVERLRWMFDYASREAAHLRDDVTWSRYREDLAARYEEMHG